MSIKRDLWIRTCLTPAATVREAINSLNNSGLRIVLIIDDNGNFLGTISDGDIRSLMLERYNLDLPIIEIYNPNSVVASPTYEIEAVKNLMVKFNVQQIPIVDEFGKLCGLHVWNELDDKKRITCPMLIMAGGRGTRLYPHTQNCPKPMLKVNGKPILEHIIQRAKKNGFENFVISTNYLGEQIRSYFGNGDRLDVKIDYLNENEPLGTAGSLRQLNFDKSSDTLITNGDVLTDLDYSSFLEFHKKQNTILTVAVRLIEFQNPFGVLEINQTKVVEYLEKPLTMSHINAGIYATNQNIKNYFPEAAKFDMSELIQNLLEAQVKVSAYLIHEEWLDIGTQKSLFLANGRIDEKSID